MTYESIIRIDAVDADNILQLVSDIIMTEEVDSPFGGIVEVECFDDRLYFNALERGLWRLDQRDNSLVRLLNSAEDGALPPHTNNSLQHVSSIKSMGDALLVLTDSDLLVSHDGLTFSTVLSPGINSFAESSIDSRARVIGNDEVGYYLIYNAGG